MQCALIFVFLNEHALSFPFFVFQLNNPAERESSKTNSTILQNENLSKPTQQPILAKIVGEKAVDTNNFANQVAFRRINFAFLCRIYHI